MAKGKKYMPAQIVSWLRQIEVSVWTARFVARPFI